MLEPLHPKCTTKLDGFGVWRRRGRGIRIARLTTTAQDGAGNRDRRHKYHLQIIRRRILFISVYKASFLPFGNRNSSSQSAQPDNFRAISVDFPRQQLGESAQLGTCAERRIPVNPCPIESGISCYRPQSVLVERRVYQLLWCWVNASLSRRCRGPTLRPPPAHPALIN